MKSTRREFIRGAAGAGVFTILPSGIYAQAGKRQSPNGKIQVACIGIGGRGGAAISGCADEKIIGMCDVDDRMTKQVYGKFPDASKFKDYREMLEQLGDKIDAVTISTPDHLHFDQAMAAVKAGKHVYVEKPLCQTIEQTRLLKAAADKAGVKTQMGNQGHSRPGIRDFKEQVMAGMIGDVKKIEAWTDRPSGWWAQGMEKLPEAGKVPKELDWDLWRNGVELAYSEAYLPFKWRGWTQWGSGALGDMACHILDPVYYALDLGLPDWIEAEVEGGSEFAYPNKSTVTYHFPARGELSEVTLVWRDGKDNVPDRPKALEKGRNMGNSSGGTLSYGSKEVVMSDSHASLVRVIPNARAKALQRPERTLRRVKNAAHFGDWFAAIRGEIDDASSHFGYSAGLNEMVLLGTIAQRLPGKRLMWDAQAGQFTNTEVGNKLIANVMI